MIKVFIELDILTEEQQNDEMLKTLVEHHIKQLFFIPPEIRRIEIRRVDDESTNNPIEKVWSNY